MKLLLFFYCMSFRRASSQVEVLWEDHRNDLFINGFGKLLSSLSTRILSWARADLLSRSPHVCRRLETEVV